ncbi:MAG TPA: patatin-like phospholipase family protein [Candidatus Acidoferrales bacterium]|nr:patatin-like phospholipase family protein [Candidatus Acidoferrales bacterium]
MRTGTKLASFHREIVSNYQALEKRDTNMAAAKAWLHNVAEGIRAFAHGGKQMEAYRRPRIGLALGGGFARGIAHIGVLKELLDAKIPIDCIAGTSVGALIAAAYATSTPLEKMQRRALATRFTDFGKWRLSRMGFASNERLGDYLCSLSQFSRFEQAKIPLAIAATDLGTGEPVYFTEGEICPALRASCAYPGLFLPVEHQGRILVDGFLSAPVPVDAARRLGADFVIAVWLESAAPGEQANNIVEIISRSFSIMQRNGNAGWRRKADVVIEPDVVQFAWDDFQKTPQLIAAGEAATRSVIPKIRAVLVPPERIAMARPVYP